MSQELGWQQRTGQVKEAEHHVVLADLIPGIYSWTSFSQTGTEITMERNAQWVSLGKRCGGGLRICLIFIIFRGWIHSTFFVSWSTNMISFKKSPRKNWQPLPCFTLETPSADPPDHLTSDSHSLPEPGLRPSLLKVLEEDLFVFFLDVCFHISFLLF